jgi:uncharacterized protein (DUF2225 family)
MLFKYKPNVEINGLLESFNKTLAKNIRSSTMHDKNDQLVPCPKCGERGPYAIEATSIFTVMQDGTDDYGDVEWSNDSVCVCTNCGFEGTVADFTGDHSAPDNRDFWRQTAIELFNNCVNMDAVDEHLSQTQIERLHDALSEHLKREER